MKKRFRKICASVLAFALCLGMVSPLMGTVTLAKAAEDTIFNASEQTAGDITEATTFGRFTVNASAEKNVTIDGNKKFSDSGLEFTQRMKLNGSGNAEVRNVSFTTSGPATIIVYAMSGSSSEDRPLLLMAADGVTELSRATALGTVDESIIPVITFEVTEAGTYYIWSASKSINIYYMEIKETAAPTAGGKTLVFNASEQTAGDFTDVTVLGDFTVIATAEKNVTIDGNKKFSDSGLEFTQRLKLNGTGTVEGRAFSFTTGGAATVTVYAMSGSSSENRPLVLLSADGTEVGRQEALGTVDESIIPALTYEVTEAGTYYFVSGSKGLNIYYVEVKEAGGAVAAEPSVLNASELTAGDFTDVTVLGDFTVIATAEKNVTIDGNSKFSDSGLEFTQRLKLNGTGTVEGRALSFTTSGAATVTVYAMSGSSSENRPLVLLSADGTEVGRQEAPGTVDESIIPALTYEVTEAGTYYFVSGSKGLNIYYVEVMPEGGGAVAEPERAAWNTVAAPVLGEPVISTGKIKVPYTMLIGPATDGCDRLYVYMYDATGAEVDKVTVAVQSTEGVAEFSPVATGDYTFTAEAVRTDEESVLSGNTVEAKGYVLPLGVTTITSATSTGNGKISIVWLPVDEAEAYIVSYRVDDTTDAFTEAGKVTTTEFVVEGLTVGTKYEFSVQAVRGTEVAGAATMSASATAAEQRVWSFVAYGSSTKADEKNTYTGSVNEDGQVTVISTGNGGKLTTDADGISFYYTVIDPETENFKLSATATVDTWTFSNGQEGFGLMVADRIGEHGDSTGILNNLFASIVSKVEYWYDPSIGEFTENTGNKITMKLGIGAQEKTGVTLENIADGTIVSNRDQLYVSEITPLEWSQRLMPGTNTFNLVGNSTNEVPGTLPDKAILTSFRFTIERNNTGYFVSYDDPITGETVTQKYYDLERNALTQLDPDNIYVGFYTARNATVTFSDIEFTVTDPATDAPAEGREIKYTSPIVSVVSGTDSGIAEHDLTLYTNASGTITVKNYLTDEVIVENVRANADDYTYVPVTLTEGQNVYAIYFTPDADFKFGEYHHLTTTETVELMHVIQHRTFEGKIIYVGKNVDPNNSGYGTKERPTDIGTAVKYVQPGQIILLEGGVYDPLYLKKVTAERGTDGTAENPIYMIADPTSTERPVLDFSMVDAGSGGAAVIIAGDYWILSGFDITNTPSGLKGLQISGNHCIVQDVNAYGNGDTGIQISRFKGTDYNEDWPSYNLILNCTSYNNADAGGENADGFGAKLTVGEGNVFDGCIAYNNSDDGYDLYAKPDTGAIGLVTIQNSLAFRNGVTLDGKLKGNGNGFKLGGDSFTGYHKLINCVAFENLAKGLDSNSCPDIQLSNCTSFNNEKYNVALYTNNGLNTDFSATGVLSFRTLYTDISETFDLRGTQDTAKVYGTSNYYFDVATGKSLNSEGAAADASWFVSLDTSVAITRNADGTINMNGLLVLTDAAPEGVGATVGGTANTDYSAIVLAAMEEDAKAQEVTPASTQAPGVDNDKDVSGNTGNGPVVAIIIVAVVAVLAIAAVAVAVVLKKKKTNK